MIASFSNNFIFLRTRKTGGTSAEIVLSSWCEKPDICTRLNETEEPMRRSFGGLRPLRSYNGKRVYHHMPAHEVKHIFHDLWNNAHKFAIERHPYEKVVSRVFWNIGKRDGNPDVEFEQELEAVLHSDVFVDREVYMIDGKIVVDDLVKYDDFWDYMLEFGKKIGKQLPENLPQAKSEHRKKKQPAREILTASQKKKIQEVAAFEFGEIGFDT